MNLKSLTVISVLTSAIPKIYYSLRDVDCFTLVALLEWSITQAEVTLVILLGYLEVRGTTFRTLTEVYSAVLLVVYASVRFRWVIESLTPHKVGLPVLQLTPNKGYVIKPWMPGCLNRVIWVVGLVPYLLLDETSRLLSSEARQVWLKALYSSSLGQAVFESRTTKNDLPKKNWYRWAKGCLYLIHKFANLTNLRVIAALLIATLLTSAYLSRLAETDRLLATGTLIFSAQVNSVALSLGLYNSSRSRDRPLPVEVSFRGLDRANAYVAITKAWNVATALVYGTALLISVVLPIIVHWCW